MTEVLVTVTFHAFDTEEADKIESAVRTLIAEIHPANVIIERRAAVK